MSDLEAWRAMTLGEVLDHLELVKEAHWQEGKSARIGPSGNNANRAKRAALDAYERAESAYVTLTRVAGYLETIEPPEGAGGRCGGPRPPGLYGA